MSFSCAAARVSSASASASSTLSILPLSASSARCLAATAAASSYESRADAIRETIDLLEADLTAMIRDVHQTSGTVRQGVQASSQALANIRERGEELASKTHSAKEDAIQLAGATEEFAASSSYIVRQVYEAGHLTQGATLAAKAAGASVDGLKDSLVEIGKVVHLIASIAKQTNLRGGFRTAYKS